jgi:hypothetical protein
MARPKTILVAYANNTQDNRIYIYRVTGRYPECTYPVPKDFFGGSKNNRVPNSYGASFKSHVILRPGVYGTVSRDGKDTIESVYLVVPTSLGLDVYTVQQVRGFDRINSRTLLSLEVECQTLGYSLSEFAIPHGDYVYLPEEVLSIVRVISSTAMVASLLSLLPQRSRYVLTENMQQLCSQGLPCMSNRDRQSILSKLVTGIEE